MQSFLKKIAVVDAFTMKVIMAVLMFLDHLYWFLPDMPYWFEQASRVVVPMFAMLVAEGMVHTRDRLAYIKRMYNVGGVMVAAQAVFYLIFRDFPPNSIIMSLAITASMIYCIDKLRAKEGKNAKYTVLLILLVFASIAFEGMFMCQITGLVCYYLRGRKLLMCVVYLIAMGAFLALIGMLSDTQGLMLLAVIPFLLYSGERGYNTPAAKNFFYVFYPSHIWILYTIRMLVAS